jgi:DNA-binding Lrp family transcriptional regulator
LSYCSRYGGIVEEMKMAAFFIGKEVSPEILRLMLLSFGLRHAYRVLSLEDIARAVSHISKEVVRKGLEGLAEEGLLTRFSGRYCFNKPLTAELRRLIGRSVSSSGTLRVE